MVSASPAPQRNKEEPVEDSTPSTAGMKSRFQRLAEQRKVWDGKNTLCISILKTQSMIKV